MFSFLSLPLLHTSSLLVIPIRRPLSVCRCMHYTWYHENNDHHDAGSQSMHFYYIFFFHSITFLSDTTTNLSQECCLCEKKMSLTLSVSKVSFLWTTCKSISESYTEWFCCSISHILMSDGCPLSCFHSFLLTQRQHLVLVIHSRDIDLQRQNHNGMQYLFIRARICTSTWLHHSSLANSPPRHGGWIRLFTRLEWGRSEGSEPLSSSSYCYWFNVRSLFYSILPGYA